MFEILMSWTQFFVGVKRIAKKKVLMLKGSYRHHVGLSDYTFWHATTFSTPSAKRLFIKSTFRFDICHMTACMFELHLNAIERLKE
jgi:hypothetical protein